MPPKLVSIMMPAYNAERYIFQAVESALAQTYQSWELIIVNDGSTDRTAEIIAGFNDGRIKIHHQTNAGEASARNTALGHSNGDYIAFLDADDLYLPEHLETAVTYLNAHPEHDGVYTDGYYIDENGVRLKALSCRRRGPFEGDIFEEMVRSSDVFGTPLCVVLRRDLISRENLHFDEEIVIGPDWDFFIRYAEVASFGHTDQATCLYRVHQTNISIQTGLEKRLAHLAKCREKTIKLSRFQGCSLQTRVQVFYDLLVNLLPRDQERQANILKWEEFTDLPADERSRLLRLMASEAIRRGQYNKYAGEWLLLSIKNNPMEIRGAILYALYTLSPRLCGVLLKKKKSMQQNRIDLSPFSDLVELGKPV